MHDVTLDFDAFLTRTLGEYAEHGVAPIDAVAIATAAAARRQRRGLKGRYFTPSSLDRRDIRAPWFDALPQVVRVGIVVALTVAALVAVAVVGGRVSRLVLPPLASNGWIAFTVSDAGDPDIWLVGLDREAHLAVGTQTDSVAQLCPAFSPDGGSLAYARVEGSDGRAALAVADVTDDGRVTDRIAIDVGPGKPPPCPVWSPKGDQIAFGVPRTSPINPSTSAAGSEVWVVTLADGGITVLPDLLATDLDWSPDGSTLAIASGTDALDYGSALKDGRIHLYARSSGAVRTLDETLGAIELTWSPDGRFIAYTGVPPSAGDDRRGLLVTDVATGQARALTAPYGVLHGIGPVWSPDGETIVYQRGFSGEHSEVILLTPGDLSDASTSPREAVVPGSAKESSERFDQYRVTWSPDGRYLLTVAWGVQSGLLAVPVDPALQIVVLFRMDGLVAYDGYGEDATFVPIQTWGRMPTD